MRSGKGILSSLQRLFLHLFSTLPDQQNFYLSGGTALAEYYLGHRLSFDLDLFTGELDLILPFSYQVEAAARQAGYGVKVVRRFSSFVEFQISHESDTLKIDLAQDSVFRLAQPERTDLGVLVNDYLDLQADKTLAFFGRAEPRDAVDLFFLLREISLDELTNLARQKDTGFDLYWFSVALNRAENFPDEIERWPVKMLMDFDPKMLKKSFKDLAMRILDDMA